MEEKKTIARYRLTGELGRGGMGVVYRAEDPQLGRPVAIKVILFPPQATDDFRAQLEKRFEREARSAAGIHHPGVVTVHDFGRDGDYLFLVMELVAGESLADRLKTGWLPERAEAFEIAAKVADGLAAAHAAGVVHRDVTPRNILMAKDGRVVVTDFGIARSVSEETFELTRTGMLVGSPSFMAPEQVRSKDFDARADIFSLGVVLYLLLTGKLPFSSQDLTSLLYQIVHEDPFESPEVKGKLGLGTVKFLQRCLAKEAADRVQTAGEFAREARRLRAAAQTAEFEETVALGAITRKKTERKRSFASLRGDPAGRGGRLGLALALIATAVAGVWALTSLSGDRPAPKALPAVETAGNQELEPVPTEAITVPALTVESLSEATDLAADQDPPPSRETAADPPMPPPPATVAPTPAPLERQPEDSQPPVVEPTAGDSPPDLESPSPAKTLPASTVLASTVLADHVTADTVPPILDVDATPRDLTATEVELSGRVMDDSKQVTLTVDGDEVTINAGGEFVTRRPLAPGRNALAFVATDPAGNQTMKRIEVSALTDPTTTRTAEGPRPQTAGARPASARPRFADRGDGTLFDTLTRITWTKRPEASPSWKASKSYCKKLELGRHGDWVLPTIEELEELYRSGATAAGLVWSSTRNGSGRAWTFDFTQAQRAGQPATGAEGVDFKTLCLRRERPRTQAPDLESPFGPIDSRNTGGGLPPPPGGGQPPPPRGGGGGQGGGGGGQGGGGQGGGGGGE